MWRRPGGDTTDLPSVAVTLGKLALSTKTLSTRLDDAGAEEIRRHEDIIWYNDDEHCSRILDINDASASQSAGNLFPSSMNMMSQSRANAKEDDVLY